MSIFRILELLVFIAYKGAFSFQIIVKVIFLTNIALNKVGKWPYLDRHHGLTPLEKLQFFDILKFLFLQPRKAFFRLFELQVFIAQKGDFSIQNIEKLICLTYTAKKKNVGKMAIFGTKPWVNPFGKMSIFRILELLVFIAYKGAFSFQIIVKIIFLTYSAENKMLEKWPYLNQNHGLTPLEKLQFFDILNFLFLQPRKAFFRLFELQVFIAQKGDFSIQNIEKLICLTFTAKKKMLEKWPNLEQNPGLTPLQKCQFFHCRNFFFLLPRKAFFKSKISKKSFS